MFTGIIETLGTIQELRKEGENIHVSVQSNITNELKIDQSVAHNGVCLTVVAIDNDTYTVTAIKETIDKTNLGDWNIGRQSKFGTRHEIGRPIGRTYCARTCGPNRCLHKH